jgi:hypothetical protein
MESGARYFRNGSDFDHQIRMVKPFDLDGCRDGIGR